MYNKGDTEVRFDFVIADNSARGQGIGKEMLELAMKYAVEILRAKRITLGVFEDNLSAQHCCKAVDFAKCKSKGEFFEVFGEPWKCIEMEMEIL